MSENEKYFAPPWIKYPNAPKDSNFWKDGSGAEYLLKYNENVVENETFLELFPKAPTFKDNLIPSDELSNQTRDFIDKYLNSMLIKLWDTSGKPKYENIEYKEGNYIEMYDSIGSDDSTNIPVGTNHYHSINELITVVHDKINSTTREIVWDELKYTIGLNALYYKFITDINFVNELIKTNDAVIVYKSDNLDFGLSKDDNGKLIGNNLLGLAIMEIRDVIKDVYKNYDLIDWNISGKPNSVVRCMCNHHNH